MAYTVQVILHGCQGVQTGADAGFEYYVDRSHVAECANAGGHGIHTKVPAE